MAFLDLSNLGLITDPSTLVQMWLNFIQASYPNYVPAQGAIEWLTAQAVSVIAANYTQTALVVPDAIWRAYGTKLVGLPYLTGIAAVTTIQVTAVDTQGYTLSAGTYVQLGSYGFQTSDDLTIPAGQNLGTVTVVASAPGASFNGAGGSGQVVEFGTTVNWCAAVICLAPATQGTDAEDDAAYETRLSFALQLQSQSVCTAPDFALMALNFQPSFGTTDETVGRATALDGYAPGPAAFTATLVSGEYTITVVPVNPPNNGIYAAPGSPVSGTGIPTGTIVLSATVPTPSQASSVTLSNAVTTTGSSVAVTIGSSAGGGVSPGGTLGNQRTVTVCITDADGNALNAGTLTDVGQWLASKREVGFVVNAIDPTQTLVYVTVEVVLVPGADPTASQNAIQASLLAYLNPANWGIPPTTSNSGQWFNSATIYYNNLIAVVSSNSCVDHVVDGSLALGTSAPTLTSDLVIPGPCAQPTSTGVPYVVGVTPTPSGPTNSITVTVAS